MQASGNGDHDGPPQHGALPRTRELCFAVLHAEEVLEDHSVLHVGWSRRSLVSAPLFLPFTRGGHKLPPSRPSKLTSPLPSCFALQPYKNMAAPRAPPKSQHAPGSRSGLSVRQEDGDLRGGAAGPDTIRGVTEGSVSGSALLAGRSIGGPSLPRSHRSFARPS